MTRWLSVFGMLLCPLTLVADGTLTSIKAIQSLSRQAAVQELPVTFEGTVTFYDNNGGSDLFLQDGDLAIYVYARPGGGFVTGDRVLVRGKTHMDFRPDVVAEQVTFLHGGPPVTPVRATFRQLIRAELDCVRVTITARVRSADQTRAQNESGTYLTLQTDGGKVDALIAEQDETRLKELRDATVEVTGAAAGKFDSKMQLVGILIEVPRLSDVKIIEPAKADTLSLPVTPMNEILRGYQSDDTSERIRTRGAITYYQPGGALVLQHGSESLWVTTLYEGPLRIGQIADATGFPDSSSGNLTLTLSEVHGTAEQAPVRPTTLDWAALAGGTHAFDLISTEGRVLASVRGATQDEYLLDSNGHPFSAIFRHPEPGNAPLPQMKHVAVGSRIRVTGICTLEYGADPLGAPVAFHVLLRSFDDVELMARPSLLSVKNLVIAFGLLLLVVLGVGFRSWILERRIRYQTAAIAARTEAEAEMERRRSRILEDINSRRRLTEILEHIVELVSFNLNGAPCWCEMGDGSQIGIRPDIPEDFVVTRKEILSRSGATHGAIIAAVETSKGSAHDALSMGSNLATLAIETRVLFSDLLHRSEFDKLTDTNNRSALDAHVEDLIAQNRQFGLIYIDLDHFKQVNDQYGHLVGDLYLREASARMRLQLRPGDMLARLGGDEFSVVLQNVPGRLEVEVVAQRLVTCFNDVFVLDHYQISGSASVGIALYPENGLTRDDLLSAADAAMYMSKHLARHSLVNGAGAGSV